ncbi:hypothetical protein N0V88_002892 [Collariella sp. IMI 366227]|nr:hypothetical protein N0V88_002892 [Collariella sp. IMI 366227]
MGVQQPFMYEAVNRDENRFPATTFDPKAITRASYEKKKPKPKPKGPLVSVNRHPDAHMVPNGRSNFKTMGRRTKGWIKGMRVVQLLLRILEVIGAVGLLVVMSLINLMGWVMGATLGVAIIHCLYSIFHHARPAGSRTPGSSTAYHIFSAVSDLCILPLYVYGIITTRNTNWAEKKTRFDGDLVARYMEPSVYYGLIGAGGLHVLSLTISLWLAFMFRRISSMPPDMNPLEANLTSRVHKKNKSSVATASTYTDSEKRDSQLYDDTSRPPSIPFMHTRQNSETSFTSRDSRVTLPSRQYQVEAGNRNSATSQNLKRMSAQPSSKRASYTEIPIGETGASPARPISMYTGPDPRPSSSSSRAEPVSPARPPSRAPQIHRNLVHLRFTHQPHRKAHPRHKQAGRRLPNQNQRYESLRRNLDVSDDSDAENATDSDFNYYYYRTSGPNPPSLPHHPPQPPQPLRSNPTTSPSTTTTTLLPTPSPTKPAGRRPRTLLSSPRLRSGRGLLNDRRTKLDPTRREFCYSKPYGTLKAGRRRLWLVVRD